MQEADFKVIDSDGHGHILLIEFCKWIENAEIAAKTPFGADLAEGAELEQRLVAMKKGGVGGTPSATVLAALTAQSSPPVQLEEFKVVSQTSEKSAAPPTERLGYAEQDTQVKIRQLQKQTDAALAKEDFKKVEELQKQMDRSKETLPPRELKFVLDCFNWFNK